MSRHARPGPWVTVTRKSTGGEAYDVLIEVDGRRVAEWTEHVTRPEDNDRIINKVNKLVRENTDGDHDGTEAGGVAD